MRCARLLTALIPILVVLQVAPSPARGSGTYRTGPPEASGIDESRYHLGKELFTGRVTPAELQRASLRRLETCLAEHGEERDLDPLAGQIDAVALDALVWYVAVLTGAKDADPARFERGRGVFEKGHGSGPPVAPRLLELLDILPDDAVADGVVFLRGSDLEIPEVEAVRFYVAARFGLESLDPERWELGAALLRGDEAPVGASDDGIATQWAGVEARLPEDVRAEIDLPGLARRLDAPHRDALLYYIQVRYKVQG